MIPSKLLAAALGSFALSTALSTAGVLCFSGWTASSALADEPSAADLLLQSVTPVQKVAKPGPAKEALPSWGSEGVAPRMDQFKITDPFLTQLFAEWRTHPNLPAPVSKWFETLLVQDWDTAAQLLADTSPVFPANLQDVAKASRIYLEIKLGLHMTAFDEWMTALQSKDWRLSPISIAFEQVMVPMLETWLVEQHQTPTAEQRKMLLETPLEEGKRAVVLAAWAAVREGRSGEKALGLLEQGSPFRIPLGRSLAYVLAKQGDIPGAARALKAYVEPELDRIRDPEQRATHLLQVARLLFQAGAFAGAEGFYLKIPGGSRHFLSAREELLWVWLKMGKLDRLRGELLSFERYPLGQRFAPEFWLVKAIGDFKLCNYDLTQKNLSRFVSSNTPWAKTIEERIANASEAHADEANDTFITLEKDNLVANEVELDAIKRLAHADRPLWRQMTEGLELRKKGTTERLAQEKKRFWLGRQGELKEAIRKMRFVRVELQSQLRRMALAQKSGTDELQMESAAPQRAELMAEPGKLVFPVDQLWWPDELFRLRAAAQGRCRSQLKKGT